jgi:hypothetical protein
MLDDLRSALHRLDRQGSDRQGSKPRASNTHRNPGRDGRTRQDTRAE